MRASSSPITSDALSLPCGKSIWICSWDGKGEGELPLYSPEPVKFRETPELEPLHPQIPNPQKIQQRLQPHIPQSVRIFLTLNCKP